MSELFSAVSKVWNVISNPVINGVTLLASAQKKADELFVQIQFLEALKDQLNLRVETLAFEDLTNKQMSRPVKIWSKQVENLILSSRNVERQFEERQSSWNCFTCGCCWNYALVSEAVELRRRVDECMEMGRQFTDVEIAIDAPEQVEIISFYHGVVGQYEEMKTALQLILQDDGIGIVGIYGTCGVGKTTLLQRINNHFYNNRSDFHDIIFVTASRDAISVQRLRMDIAKRLGLLLSPTETAGNEDNQRKRILKYLECRNFLLLMDDVREVVDLKELGIPPLNSYMEDGSKKIQKVVIATRDKGVFSNLIGRSLEVIEMGLRGREESWQLFRGYLHNKELLQGDEEVEGLLRAIADECHGLPPKLITAAKSLSPYCGGEEGMNDENLVSLRTLVIKKFMPFQEKRKALMSLNQDMEATLKHLISLYGDVIMECSVVRDCDCLIDSSRISNMLSKARKGFFFTQGSKLMVSPACGPEDDIFGKVVWLIEEYEKSLDELSSCIRRAKLKVRNSPPMHEFRLFSLVKRELLFIQPKELYLESGQGTTTCFEIYNRTDRHLAFKVVLESSEDHHFPCDIQPEMGMVKPQSSLKVVLTPTVRGKHEQYEWLYVLFTVPREGVSTVITSNMFTENIVERLWLTVCPTVETPRPNSLSTKEDGFVRTESRVLVKPSEAPVLVKTSEASVLVKPSEAPVLVKPKKAPVLMKPSEAQVKPTWLVLLESSLTRS